MSKIGQNRFAAAAEMDAAAAKGDGATAEIVQDAYLDLDSLWGLPLYATLPQNPQWLNAAAAKPDTQS